MSSWKLVPRATPSRRWIWLSPLVAIALTLLAGCALFAALGKKPYRRIEHFHCRAVDECARLAGACIKSDTVGVVRLGACPVLSYQRLEHRCRGTANCWRNCWRRRCIARDTRVTAHLVRRGFCWLDGRRRTLGFDHRMVARSFQRQRDSREFDVGVRRSAVDLLARTGTLARSDGYGFPQTELFAVAARVPLLFDGARLNIGVALRC